MKAPCNALLIYQEVESKYEYDITYPFDDVIQFIKQVIGKQGYKCYDYYDIIRFLNIFFIGEVEVDGLKSLGIRLNYPRAFMKSPENLTEDTVKQLNIRVDEVLG